MQPAFRGQHLRGGQSFDLVCFVRNDMDRADPVTSGNLFQHALDHGYAQHRRDTLLRYARPGRQGVHNAGTLAGHDKCCDFSVHGQANSPELPERKLLSCEDEPCSR